MPKQIAPGLVVETVGDILDRGNPQSPSEGVPDGPTPVMPPRLDGQPEFPVPGLYFGMSDEVYHAINACSASLIKDMSVSPMYAWARSPLNPEREDDDTIFKILGRAYHVRICEGLDAYNATYAVELDRADYPDVLVTTDNLIAAIIEAGATPVTRIETGQMKPAPTIKEPDRVKPVTRAATKSDLIAQLIELSPDAQIWDALVADHAADHAGMILISAKDDRRIQVAARMIEIDPALGKAFSGGHAEISLFAYDPKTGAPCKARIDYLKLKAFVDLKSFSLKTERPVDRAIDFEIASRKHYVPVVHYSDMIAWVKELIRTQGAAAVVHSCDTEKDEDVPWLADPIEIDREKWAAKWADVPDDLTPLYVFQATGIAPVTRGRILQRGTTHAVTRMAVEMYRAKYVRCVQTFGSDPWIDTAEISNVIDENMPMSAVDFGEIE